MAMRVDYFEAMKAFRKNIQANGDWDKLTAEEQRYVDKLIHGMERSGLNLPKEKRDQIEKL